MLNFPRARGGKTFILAKSNEVMFEKQTDQTRRESADVVAVWLCVRKCMYV